MARKASVVVEKDENGFYAWSPELKGCQSQGATLEETIANINKSPEKPASRQRLRDSAGSVTRNFVRTSTADSVQVC